MSSVKGSPARMRATLEKEKAAGAEEAAPPPEDVQLLTEIRDLLKSRPAI